MYTEEHRLVRDSRSISKLVGLFLDLAWAPYAVETPDQALTTFASIVLKTGSITHYITEQLDLGAELNPIAKKRSMKATVISPAASRPKNRLSSGIEMS